MTRKIKPRQQEKAFDGSESTTGSLEKNNAKVLRTHETEFLKPRWCVERAWQRVDIQEIIIAGFIDNWGFLIRVRTPWNSAYNAGGVPVLSLPFNSMSQ